MIRSTAGSHLRRVSDPPSDQEVIVSHIAEPAPQSAWRRLLALEPAVVRGVIAALVLVLGLWGVDVADLGGRVETTILTLLTLVPLLSAWWTRAAVTPNARVVESVRDGVVEAGPANDLVVTGDVVRVIGDEPEF